jgi:hypothetical protein
MLYSYSRNSTSKVYHIVVPIVSDPRFRSSVCKFVSLCAMPLIRVEAEPPRGRRLCKNCDGLTPYAGSAMVLQALDKGLQPYGSRVAFDSMAR